MALEDLASNLGEVIVNYKESIVSSDDIANKEIQNKVVEETFQLPLVQKIEQATLITDRLIQTKAYPLARINLVLNRKAARFQRGDLFKLTYSPYSITNMIVRVLEVKEENLESENILLSVIEDINYLSTNIDTDNEDLIGSVGTTERPTTQFVEPLINITIQEAPYVISGNEVGVLPIASRITGSELGYQVYISIDDGVSYSLIDSVPSFTPSGTLVAEYPNTTKTIDDEVGFQIDSTDPDIDNLATITRASLFLDDNLAIINDEIIAFQTIIPHPVTDDRYIISGVYRGRFDSEQETHALGSTFYYLSDSNSKFVQSPRIVPGAVLKFKFVPYSSFVGNIADATAIDYTVTGRSRKPYRPINLRANSILVHPTYSTDIVLDWDPRLRTEGAGIGLADSITDASPTYEGLFEVKVYVSDVLVRTTTAIDALTWTYTSSMNTSDNGALADEVVFTLSNYRTENNYVYSSGLTTQTVKKI